MKQANKKPCYFHCESNLQIDLENSSYPKAFMFLSRVLHTQVLYILIKFIHKEFIVSSIVLSNRYCLYEKNYLLLYVNFVITILLNLFLIFFQISCLYQLYIQIYRYIILLLPHNINFVSSFLIFITCFFLLSNCTTKDFQNNVMYLW